MNLSNAHDADRVLKLELLQKLAKELHCFNDGEHMVTVMLEVSGLERGEINANLHWKTEQAGGEFQTLEEGIEMLLRIRKKIKGI